MISNNFNMTNKLTSPCGGATQKQWNRLFARTKKTVPALANIKDPASCWDKKKGGKR